MSETVFDIQPLDLNKEVPALLNLWERLYHKEPHYVMPLRLERKEFLNPKKNPYFQLATIQFFGARKGQGGKLLGSICAHVDQTYQVGFPGTGFFGFYEFPNDPAVSESLFEAARGYLRSLGMTRMLGPFHFNTNHECGLLVSGFNRDPALLTTWNPPYHEAHYNRLGMQKAKDLLTYGLRPAPVPPRVLTLANRVLRNHPEIHIRPLNIADFDGETRRIFEIYNDAWQDNWGFVRMTQKEFFHMARGLKLIIDPRFAYLAEVHGEPAAFSLTLPDINQVIKPLRGRLFPFGWARLLLGKRNVRNLRVFALGIKKRFQSLAIGAPLYVRTWEAALSASVEGAEASWILEDNHRMCGALAKLGGQIEKTHRIYEAPV